MMRAGALLRSEKMGVLLGRLFEAAGSLCFLKLLSVLATKNEVGQYLLASSVLAFMLTVSYSALDQGMLRNVAEYRLQGVLPSRYSAMLSAYFSTAGLLAIAFLAVIDAFDGLRDIREMKIPLAIWLTFEAVKNFNNAWASALRQRFRMAGASFIEQGSKVLVLWILFSFDAVSASSIVLLMCLSGAVAVAFLVWAQRALLSRFSPAELLATLKDALQFSWPMIIWGAFGWFQNMSSRWYIGNFMDLSTVAEYGVLFSIATFPVTAAFGFVVMYIVPILYEKETAQAGASQRFVVRTALMMAPACSLMVLLTYEGRNLIISVLSGPEYMARSLYLPVLMGASCLHYLGSILTYGIYAQRKVSSLLAANILPGLFGLIFGYYAVQWNGFEGAVLTFVLSSVLSCSLFVLTFLSQRRRA